MTNTSCGPGAGVAPLPTGGRSANRVEPIVTLDEADLIVVEAARPHAIRIPNTSAETVTVTLTLTW